MNDDSDVFEISEEEDDDEVDSGVLRNDCNIELHFDGNSSSISRLSTSVVDLNNNSDNSSNE